MFNGANLTLNSDVNQDKFQTQISYKDSDPYDKIAKNYTNCFGHMTKMAATPINGKTLYNKATEFDQEIPQSHLADQPTAS